MTRYVQRLLPEPVAGATLPERCLVVSIDAESIDSRDSKKGRLVPQAAISFGLSLWLKVGHCLGAVLENGKPLMRHYTMVPTAPPDPVTMAWWAQHPAAYDRATRDPRPAREVGHALWQFLHGAEIPYIPHVPYWPLVLVAQPWAYDGGIMDYLLGLAKQPVGDIRAFGLRPLLMAHHGWTADETKALWDAQMEANGPMPHEADVDAYIQGKTLADLWMRTP